MNYSDSYPRIQAISITVEDADLLERLQEDGKRIELSVSSSSAMRGTCTGRCQHDYILVVH